MRVHLGLSMSVEQFLIMALILSVVIIGLAYMAMRRYSQ